MSIDLDAVLRAALALSAEDRARLADSLLTTLDEAQEQDIESAWAAEVRRRSREFDEGRATMISWSELREAVRRRFATNG
jgi:putative addiction module component (TIGR02574 family)